MAVSKAKRSEAGKKVAEILRQQLEGRMDLKK